MANELNYNGQIQSADDYLAKAQSLPQNASADGNGGSFEIADTLGSIEVVAKVNSEITLTDAKVLTIKLQDSDDDSSFADLSSVYTVTGSTTVLAANTELGRVTIPTDAKRYVKAVITTDDSAAAGKVDISLNYLPR